METVGFSTETQRRIFCVLSAVLHLGNIEYRRKADHQHHEAVCIKNNTTVKIISNLLKVKEATLVEALTKKKTTAGGETVVFSYNMPHALATRDAVAKCLYGGLFDWIVLQVNHALLAKKDYREHHGNSIGVLDIFGFEDFGNNSFEQFCINYANERLHYYFNQHIFKFEQEEYIHEGISWKNIEFIDNTGCLDLFSRRLTGLLALIDEECNFPGATDDTLLSKLHAQHKDNPYYEVPQMKESAFTIVHYAGNVKYQIQAFREKNADLMRHDIVLVLKNSGLAFVRELVGYDPVAVLRWAIVRAFFRAYFAFLDAGKRHRKNSASEKSNNIIPESPKKTPVSSVEQRPPRRRVIIVEKYGNKHASYHGDMSTDILGSPPPDFDPESGLLNNQEDHRVVLHATEAWNTPPRDQTIRKANRALQKSKSFRPRSKSVKTFRDLQTMKTLACRAFNPRSSKGKNKPPSVSQQFNHSLSKLMETLNQANPFFIRCIKSNAEKAPIKFDEEIVLRQLRYTGMLATVRIRQSGYNYRLPFDEFIQQYKILLPHGLHSSREDIMAFLDTLELPRDSYQLGKTKIFLREAQKLLLDDSLHRAIIRRIVNIQRWVKTKLERKRFLRLRSAVVVIQASWRGYLGRRRVEQLQLRLLAAILIQRVFRGFRQRRSMRERHMAAVCIQSHIRGYLARRHVKRLQDGSHDLQRKHEAATCIQKYIRRMCAMHKVDAMRHQRMIERDERQAQGDSAKPHVAPSPIPSRDTLPAPAGRAANYYVGDDVPSPGSEKDIVAPLPFPTKKETAPPSEDTLASATLDLPTKSQDRLSYRVETFVPSATIYTLPAHTDIRTVATASVTTSPERIMAEDSRTSPTLRTPNRLRTPISPKRSRPVPNSRSHLYEVKSSDKPDSPTVPEQKIPVMTSMDIPNTVLTSERKKLYRSSEIDLPSDKLKSVPSAPEFTDLRRIPPTGPDEFDANGDSGRRWSGSSADDKVKEWERKYMMKENQKEASQSSVRSQAGPQELEIMIHPAVQKSPLQHHTTLCTDPARVPWSKKVLVAAPLATLESLTDSTDENRPYGRRIVIERRDPPEEPVSVSERRDTLTSTEDTAELEVPNNQESSSALSPFHRAKKHLKNFMGGGRKHHKKEGGEESEGSDTEEPTSPASSKGGAPHWPSKPGSQTRKLTKESINLDQDLPAGKRKRRKNSKKHNRDHFKCDMAHNTWSVSSTSQWKYPVDVLVKGRGELRQLDTYMGNKISELKKNEDQHRETTFDVVFKNSVISFQTDMNFVMATLQDHIELRYKELMMKFEETLKAQARQRNVNLDCETDFPTTLAINAFRGYLDEFNKKKKPMKDVPLRETKKEKKTRKEKEREQIMERLGHRFQLNSFNIPTYCELCSSLIWMVDKGLVCQVCKYTIHKKCYLKVNTKCRTGTHRKSKGTGNLIGRALDEITAEGEKVSSVIEKLILAIELNGLYTVGLYRKAGAAGITRKLLNSLDHEKWSDIDYNDYPIHVLTSVIKTIFRELPEPLLTYDLYDDFLRAAEVSDDKARIQLLYSVIERLPTLNHDVLESLVFHLAKVAQHEDSNRMTCSALAIVFAPSLLRSNRNMPAQESLLQVGKQTRCLECVIGEQLRKVETTLKDINSLETATASANDRLSQVRASIRANEQQEPVSPGASAPTSPTVMETDPVQEEKILTQQISTLRKEKEKLTITMPALECRHSSSEEDILSADDIESTADTTDGQDPFYEEFAATFDDLPVSPSKSLRHLNKHRAPTPIRRQPTKRHHAVAATATVAASDKPAGNPSNLASKPGLASPELTQVGEEILV